MVWFGVGLALISAVLSPLTRRLQATGLWLGKVIASPEMASVQPRGLQDALTAGWPSQLGLAVGILPLAATAIAFVRGWPAALLVLVLYLLSRNVADRMPYVPRSVDWYINQLLQHAYRRQANYLKAGDVERAEAARSLAKMVQPVLARFLGTGVQAPDILVAQRTPLGDPEWLFMAADSGVMAGRK